MRGQAWWRWVLVVGAFVASVLLVVVPGREVEGGGEFVPLAGPVRLLDTRPGSATIDGEFAGIGLRPAGSTLQLDIAGRAGLPADAASVVLNVTAVDASGWGYVTVHPSGTARPNASNLNYDQGQTIANTVITSVGNDGDVLIFAYAATHLLVDAIGYLPTDAFDALPAAARLLDTRPGTATVDGQFAGIGRRAAGSTIELDVAGRAGIPADATSVVLNVTATSPEGWGFVTVHPTGTARPNASNLNYDFADTIANTVVTRVGTDGRVSVYTYAASHLIVDVAGHLPAASFTPLAAPARIVDTRLDAGTIDGQQASNGLRPASSTLQVDVAGRAGLPADASSVVLNVTAVDALGWGYITEFPTGTSRPNASNLNYDTGTTIANTVVARLGAGGDVCIYTYWATHLIVDVIGHLPGPPPPSDGPTCPPMKYGNPRSLGTGVTVSDINNAGIVVGAADVDSDGFPEAVWWPTLASGPQPVPGVPGDARSSAAGPINDRNQALVGTWSDGYDSDYFVVDLPSGHVAQLPDLEDVPALDGVAVARPQSAGLNDRGEVVLNLVQGSHDPEGVVVVWDSATGAIRTHPELMDVSWAYDINDLGHVVGAAHGADGLFDAFYWDLDADVLHGIEQGSFVGAWAKGVNDRGQLVGDAFDGQGESTALFWSDRDTAPTAIPAPRFSVVTINEAGLALAYSLGVWESASGQWLDFPWQSGYSLGAINDVGQVVGSTGNEQPAAIWHPI